MLLDAKAKKYKSAAEHLTVLCEKVQTQNEQLVVRINTMKKLLRRRERDVDLLKRRLDRHHDIWRNLPMIAPHPKRKIEQKRGPKPKVKASNEGTPPAEKVRKPRARKVPPEVKSSVQFASQNFGEQPQHQLNMQRKFVQLKKPEYGPSIKTAK